MGTATQQRPKSDREVDDIFEVTPEGQIQDTEKRDNPLRVLVNVVLTGSRATKRGLTSKRAKKIYAFTGSAILAALLLAGLVYLGMYINNVLILTNPTLAYALIGGVMAIFYLRVARQIYKGVKRGWSAIRDREPKVTTNPVEAAMAGGV